MKLHNTQQACLAQLDKDIAVWKKVEFICCTNGLFDTLDSKVAWAAKDMVNHVVAGLASPLSPLTNGGNLPSPLWFWYLIYRSQTWLPHMAPCKTRTELISSSPNTAQPKEGFSHLSTTWPMLWKRMHLLPHPTYHPSPA